MPNPGSSAAKRMGCTCSPLENHFGEGVVEDGIMLSDVFILADDCPIHADQRTTDVDRGGDESSEGGKESGGQLG